MLNAKGEEVAEDEVRGAVADAGGLHERDEARHVMLCCGTLGYAVLCSRMLCYVKLCCFM